MTHLKGKKIMAVLLALLLVVGVLPAGASAAGGSLVLEAGSVTASVEAGATVRVPINATANSGYGSGVLTVSWNKTALELKDVEYSALAPKGFSAGIQNTGKYIIDFGDVLATENYTGTGTFFTLVFAVRSGAAKGDYTVSLSDFDVCDKDIEPLTVSGKDGTVTLTDAPAVTLTGITVTKAPAKTEYTEGESFDAAGMEVTAKYSDDSTAVVTDYTFSPSGALKTSDESVTVSYTEGEVTVKAKQTITVKAAPAVLEGIEITTPPAKTEYTEGESFDKTGMEVTAKYSDGSTAKVTDYKLSPTGALKTGDESVTVSYTEGEVTVKAKQTITVKAAPTVLEGIEITTPPAKTEYTEGESFDKSGMEVTAKYSDGSTAKVTDYTVSPSGALKTGDESVTVSYTEGEVTVKAKQTITVKAAPAVLEGIEITTPPAKTEYTEGESFDKSGMEVTAKYSDGSTAKVTDYKLSPSGALKTSDESVTVSYTEGEVTKKAKQAITVKARQYTLTYETAGGSEVESAKYDDGTTAELTALPTREGYTFTGWYADEALTEKIASIKMDGDKTVYAGWEAEPEPEPEPELQRVNPFEDVPEEAYFYDAVMWAYYAEPQVTNGIDATHFGPVNTVTRGQAVTFLWRAMGCPEPTSTDNPFEDVPEKQYYYKAVLWAVEKGVTNGTDKTHFTPNQTCSTAHILTFLYRTMGVGANGWYEVAEAWAQGAGLLEGLEIKVAPGVDCPRSDVVLFLCRALAE